MRITHKLSLYADDLLLYVSNPVSSLSVVKDILLEFGKYSGYKLNFHKSELLPINALAKALPQSLFPFKVTTEGFRYLGVVITRSFKDLFAKNFRPLVDNCKSDITRWSALPLSLIDCVNLIKMVILPKFLYLFQHIPIFMKKSFFCQLDQTISSFLWVNKPPRIKKAILQLPKKSGGLALPN